MEIRPTRILVTGASGFTGSTVVRQLCDKGDANLEIRALVRANSNTKRLEGLPAKLVRGDLTDSASLRTALADVDFVIHTAAYVDLGVVDRKTMWRTNVEGTRLLLEESLAAGVKRLVHCGTIGVLGDTGGAVANEGTPRSQIGFSSAYDESKWQAQQLVDDYQRKGLDTLSFWPSGIMGPGDPHFGPVMDLFLSRRLKFWAGGERITGVVHVEDVASALISAMSAGQPGESYILSAGELTTNAMFDILSLRSGVRKPREVPRFLVRLVGYCLTPVGRLFSFNPPLSAERVHYLYDRCVRVDAGKARRELGWAPMPPESVIESLIP